MLVLAQEPFEVDNTGLLKYVKMYVVLFCQTLLETVQYASSEDQLRVRTDTTSYMPVLNS